MNSGTNQQCDTTEIHTGKEHYATNSGDMQEFQVFVTNQLISLSIKLDNGFSSLNKRIDDGLKRCDDRLTTLNKRFDDFIAEHPGMPMHLHESKGAEIPGIGVPDTSAKQGAKPANKQEEAAIRNPSSRQKNPIHQSNSDFDYTIATKRPRPNKMKENQDIPEAKVSNDPQPDCDPRPNYEPRRDELTSKEYLATANDWPTIQYINSASKEVTLVDIGLYSARKEQLECLLKPSMFLNDEAINCYIRVLKAQPSIQVREDGGCYLETTYNATQICGDTIASLRDKDERNIRLYRTLTYLKHEMVFLPVNIKKTHWYLVVINGGKGVIQVLDSMGEAKQRPQLKQLLQGLQNRLKRLEDLNKITNHKWRNIHVKEWRVIKCIKNRMQFDSTSCGLFMLKFMEYWTGNKLSRLFTQKDMDSFRLKLVVILVNYAWNKIKASPGFKISDVEEPYMLEETEKKDI